MVIRYMLDTDACIALIKNRPEAMRIRLSHLSPEEVGISSIVGAELWFGVAYSQKKKQNEAALKDFLDYATLLDWPCEASPLYGKIRAGLQKQGTPIGAMDLLIAFNDPPGDYEISVTELFTHKTVTQQLTVH